MSTLRCGDYAATLKIVINLINFNKNDYAFDLKVDVNILYIIVKFI